MITSRRMFMLCLIIWGSARPEISFADWQYTKWGMSVDEVIAAAPEALGKTSAEDKKKLAMQEAIPLLKGLYSTNDFRFDVQFYFAGDKLSAVRLVPNPDNGRQSILSQLSQVYGKPIEDKSQSVVQGTCHKTDRVWRDESAGNVISYWSLSCMDLPHLKIKGSFNSSVIYQPILSRKGTGL